MNKTPPRPPAQRFDAERAAVLRRDVRTGRYRVNVQRVADRLLAAARAGKAKGAAEEI